jgi:cephalosporin-C deacetylase-like acetyl esterase
MKSIQRILFSLSLLLVSGFITLAQNVVVEQSNESGIYKKGEKIVVTAHLNEMEADSIIVKTRVNYGNNVTTQKFKYPGEKLTIFTNSFNKPTSVIFHVTAGDFTTKIGLVVDPDNFKPETKYPHDLKKYWKSEKKALRALPMKVKSTPVGDIEVGFECSDVEINCTGPKPARGYFAKPELAAPKSLPIVLVVHAAGVKGSWCLAQPQKAMRYAKMGEGALCFDLNAHGMLNGQPQEYYDNLEAGELKDYMLFGLDNRDSIYFRGMYLRLLRTLDFLTNQPEWDGKRIIVIGESQGGGQSLAAAGLDKRVTAVVATVPAMCDWGRALIGEKGGWPNPFKIKNNRDKMLKTLPYFDVAHLIKGSKATIVTEIGFVDETCPSSSVYAAINQSKGKKIVFGVPYREHNLHQESFRKVWQETVLKPKNKFIEDFIK